MAILFLADIAISLKSTVSIWLSVYSITVKVKVVLVIILVVVSALILIIVVVIYKKK